MGKFKDRKDGNRYREVSSNGSEGFMDRLKHSVLYKIWLRLTRVLQFLSATISLGLFSSRVYKVMRLFKRINSASGAVEGILAAAVAYTILTTIMQFCLKGGGPRFIRWLLVVLDILFVGAFIAVAVLTRPGGPSGPCRRSGPNNIQTLIWNTATNCKLPWGTFILAIFSTLLHAITAIFHEAKDKRHHRKKESSPMRDAEEIQGATTIRHGRHASQARPFEDDKVLQASGLSDREFGSANT